MGCNAKIDNEIEPNFILKSSQTSCFCLTTASHYRDKTDLEADIVIEKADGAWGAIEVKLGGIQEDEAAGNLLTLAARVDTTNRGDPAFLAIITGGKYPYQRKDGVYVIPIGCLAP